MSSYLASNPGIDFPSNQSKNVAIAMDLSDSLYFTLMNQHRQNNHGLFDIDLKSYCKDTNTYVMTFSFVATGVSYREISGFDG